MEASGDSDMVNPRETPERAEFFVEATQAAVERIAELTHEMPSEYTRACMDRQIRHIDIMFESAFIIAHAGEAQAAAWADAAARGRAWLEANDA